MSMPFLVQYGAAFGERDATCEEAAKQLMIYAGHLKDPATGLMFHAYDESGKQPWADPMTHHSGIFWCRAIGWFGMALVDVLEVMPATHPRRAELIKRAHQLALYVVFESPLQMVSDFPERYKGEKDFEFIRQVPTTWDETHVLSGRPMEWISMARKHGDDCMWGLLRTRRRGPGGAADVSGGRAVYA